MTQENQAIKVNHVPERNRFEVNIDGQIAHLDYMKVGTTLIFTHTEVPETLEGQGIGASLAQAGLEYVRQQNLTAAPLCPFVKSFLERHPEYKPLIRLGG
jgi:uncharacterized protein